MTTVGLPGNVVVNARAMGSTRMRKQPDFGVYLCSRRSRRRVARDWTGTWRSAWLDWPPLGIPRDSPAAVAALSEAHDRAACGELVEIAGSSGRSRTGAALAALVVRGGLDADAAVSWVKQEYPRARFITPGQRHWLVGVTAELQAR
ncbi:MAG: protein-tyrosine phosphatase family protein [Actinomycetes bacterium]